MKLSVARTSDRWFNYIEKRPALAVTVAILWLFFVNGLAFFWHLGSTGLVDETEPLFAEASRQMYVTGDWITPYFNGETRFDKPALIYWFQAIAFTLIGVNEWGVRLPSALAAMGLICLAFYTVYWHLAKQDYLEEISRPTRRWLTAAVSATIMALHPQIIVWGRTGVSDMLLSACIVSALLCFYLGYAQNDKPAIQGWWYTACYVLIGAGILTKGPVAIVLPGLIIAGFLLYLGKFREVMREMRPIRGLLIIFSTAAPWYILVTLRNGDAFIQSFFGYHNVERFTNVVNRHSAPWFFYFIVVLLGFAPYSVYLPAAFARLRFWQRSYWCLQARSQQLGLFALVWFVGVFGFFTVAVTKLPSYVLPLMPAAAILVGLLWSDLFKEERKRQNQQTSNLYLLPFSFYQWSGWFNVVLVTAIGVALFYVPQIIGYDPAAPQFPSLLQQSNLTVLGGVIWLTCAVQIAVLLLRRRTLPLLGVNVVSFVLFLIFVLTPAFELSDQQRQLPLRELASLAARSQKPNEELVMVGFKKPSVVFYSQLLVNYIKGDENAGNYIREKIAKNPEPPSVLVLADPRKFPKMGLQSSDYQQLGKSGAYELIRVTN